MPNLRHMMMTGAAAIALAAPAVAQTALTSTTEADVTTATDAPTLAAESVPPTADQALNSNVTVTQDARAGTHTNATTVGTLIGQDVFSATGDAIGEIDDVVMISGENMAIVGVGGFLGIGERDVAVPLTELTLRNDAVTAMGYNRAQLDALSEFNEDAATPLEDDQTVKLGMS